jgi:glycosyltransferase involved in cell wall biosynthesis
MGSEKQLRVAVITESAMEKTHGTGAQLLRLFHERENLSYYHFFFYEGIFGKSNRPNSFLLSDKELPFRKGAGFATRLRKGMGLSWWNPDGSINARWFQKLIAENNIQCDLAYVVLADEMHTRYVLAILEQLSVPYVVHLMDLYTESGLDPKRDTGFRKLFQGAKRVIALTETMREEVCKFGIPKEAIPLVPIGQEITPYSASAPKDDQPVKMVMVGRPYEKGVQLLLDAYPALKERRGAPLEILYAGSHFSLLPPGLQEVTTNVGQISDSDAYARFLAECHLAYLSGPTDLDCFGKYSFPSRSADYLMAGLPVIAAIAPGSASERTLMPLIPDAVKIVKEPAQIRTAVDEFLESTASWEKANQMTRQFAVDQLDITKIRETIDTIVAESICP